MYSKETISTTFCHCCWWWHTRLAWSFSPSSHSSDLQLQQQQTKTHLGKFIVIHKLCIVILYCLGSIIVVADIHSSIHDVFAWEQHEIQHVALDPSPVITGPAIAVVVAVATAAAIATANVIYQFVVVVVQNQRIAIDWLCAGGSISGRQWGISTHWRVHTHTLMHVTRAMLVIIENMTQLRPRCLCLLWIRLLRPYLPTNSDCCHSEAASDHLCLCLGDSKCLDQNWSND